jgi:cinnamoyl-CoA reductase
MVAVTADDPKNTHLRALDGAAERLILCKADLLDYDAICRAVQGCHGVFHTASPVTDDPVSTLLRKPHGRRAMPMPAAELARHEQ